MAQSILFLEAKPAYLLVTLTNNPSATLKKYQAFSPMDIWKLASYPCIKIEFKRITDRLKPFNLHDEWYRNNEEVSKYILDLQDRFQERLNVASGKGDTETEIRSQAC